MVTKNSLKPEVGGYAGRLLRVNLTDGKTWIEKTGDEETLRNFLGGTGLGTKILYEETQPETKPFDSSNPLIFLTGPMTGVVPTAPKYSVISKSPVTQAYGESNSGGYFGTALKHSGFDGIIITGKAEKPVYLYITNDQIEIRDGSRIWLKDTYETDALLHEELGKEVRIAAIGPAGERMCLLAGIMNDGHDAAARTGLGAVMGSKNLKAIVVQGDEKIQVANPNRLKSLTQEYYKSVKTEKQMQYFTQHGTNGIFEPCYMIGDVPIKNFKEGIFPNYSKLTGEKMTESILKKRATCHGCPISCKRIVRVEREGLEVDGPGPEYEAVAALGPTCGNDDLEVIAKGNELCNRYGIDVISTGVTIAFLMECFEKGLITEAETEGLRLIWGSSDAILNLIHKIGRRERGLGELACNGTREAARKIGRGSIELAMQVKGLEVAMHDGRALKSKGLGYAVSPIGARANSMTPANTWCRLGMPELMKNYDSKSINDNVELCIKSQNLFATMNSTGLCMFFTAFPGRVIEMYINFLSAVTGWDLTLEEILKTGERIFNLQRVFNIRHGHTVDMDTLPKRFTHEPLSEGVAKGEVVDLNEMLPLYYELRDWNPRTGLPSLEKLKSLGLEKV